MNECSGPTVLSVALQLEEEELGLGVTIEDVLEVAFGHELVDYEAVLPVGAVADQRHQVGVL